MASVLVIGVGSTGLSAIEYAQQYYYEFTKQNSPTNTAFMFLETDENRKPKVVSNGKTEIKSCYICPENIKATLKGWQSKYSWMPSKADDLNKHAGATHPAYGRVALWSEEHNVRNMIAKLYNDIGGSPSTNIYIVGSLTGGTGTGTFIDIAYIARDVTKNGKIFGMFMLPDEKNVGDETKCRSYENAFSSLKSIDMFSKSNGGKNFVRTMPGGTEIDLGERPYYNVEFFTQDFANANASIPELSTLVQSVGFNLVLRLLDVNNQGAPFQSIVSAKWKDYQQENGFFTSIGFNVFLYPESMLEEYLTTTLIHKNILNRWADTENYIDKHGTICSIQSVLPNLKSNADNFVQYAIEESIEKCQAQSTLGHITFGVAINKEIDTITNKNYKAPSEDDYISRLFSSDSPVPKLYSAIHGQAMDLRNELTRKIAKYVDEESTRYQNLEIVKSLIEYIGESIENVINDWNKRFKIDGTAAKWNKTLQNVLTDRFKDSAVYSILLSKRALYYEALMGVAKICYFNEFMPMLKDINDSLLSRKQAKEIATPDGVILPSINYFRLISSKVRTLLSQKEENSLVARENELKGQLADNKNKQIYYLYQSGSFDSDVQLAMGKYYNQSKKLEYSEISNDELWQFLYSNEVEQIKSTMISRGLSFIQDLKLFNDNDVVNIMKNLPKEHPAHDKVSHILKGDVDNMVKDVPAMVHLVKDEMFHKYEDCFKLILVSALSEDNERCIVKSMDETTRKYFSTTSSNFILLPSMKNTVVVYQEYNYLGSEDNAGKVFNPLIHIAYQEQVRQQIKKKIESGNFDESIRLAYLTKDELMNMSNINIK